MGTVGDFQNATTRPQQTADMQLKCDAHKRKDAVHAVRPSRAQLAAALSPYGGCFHLVTLYELYFSSSRSILYLDNFW